MKRFYMYILRIPYSLVTKLNGFYMPPFYMTIGLLSRLCNDK